MRFRIFFKELKHCEVCYISALNIRWPTGLKLRVVHRLVAILLMTTGFVVDSSTADTFDEALFNQLSDNCVSLTQGQLSSGDPEILRIGSNLANVCGFSCTPDETGGVEGCVLGAGTDGSTGGSASQQTTIALILKRLRALRETDDENETQSNRLPERGASADGVFNIAPGASAFISTEYEDREKENTAFEDGYNSDLLNVTLGTDYRVKDWMGLGLAFNYSNFNGDFDEGGGFDTDSYGVFLYGVFTPLQYAFIDVVLNYARKDFDRTRQASFSRTLGFGSGATPLSFGGPVSADFNGDEFAASIAAGYDFAFERFTIGPRFGLNWASTKMESYEERGGTGLELRFEEETKVSVQSTLGVQSSLAISTNFGVLLPQMSLAWIHEFDDDQRNIHVSFAEDDRLAPVIFSFSTEKPDRDYAELNVGVSAVLPSGISAFANFRTLLGNSQFDVFGGSIGARLEF